MYKFTLIISFILLAFLISIAYAQLGEVAGPLNFNVNVSDNQTLVLTILNSGNTTLPYTVVPPSITPIVNETNPTVAISPISGALPPFHQQAINITIYIPASDKPGIMWRGVVQVIQGSNATISGGATIQSGVAKLINIYSKVPHNPSSISLYVLILLGILIILGGYFIYRQAAKARDRKTRELKTKGVKSIEIIRSRNTSVKRNKRGKS